MRHASTVLGAIVALACAPAAAAAPRWEPEPVGAPGAVIQRGLVVDGSGRAVLAYEGFRQSGAHRRFTGLATRSPGGGWVSRGDVPGLGWDGARLTDLGGGRMLLVAGRGGEILAAAGTSDGRLEPLRILARHAAGFASAADGRNDALVAWRDARSGTVRVRAWVRGSGAGAAEFEPPVRLGADGTDALALGRRGDAVLAWWSRTGLQARVRTRTGRWSPPRQVATVPRAGARQLRALVTPQGRVVLAWEIADVREDQPVRVRAGVAVHERGGHWHAFRLGGGTAVLESFPETVPAIPLAAGAATWVAWTGIRHGLPAVRVARVGPGGLGGSRLVSGRHGEAELEDAAAAPCGTLAFTYTGGGATWAALGSGAPQRLGAGLPDSRIGWARQRGEAIVTRGVVTAAGTGDLTADVSPPAGCR